MKAESKYFSNLKKAVFLAFLSIYFGSNSIHENYFQKHILYFKTKESLGKGPKKAPFFRFVKYTFSAFTRTKINVVAILDHFLAPKEWNSNTQGSQKVATCATLGKTLKLNGKVTISWVFLRKRDALRTVMHAKSFSKSLCYHYCQTYSFI